VDIKIFTPKGVKDLSWQLQSNIKVDRTTRLLFSKVKKCDDPAGRHLGRGGPTDPPQKEQCGKTVRTVLHTEPGV